MNVRKSRCTLRPLGAALLAITALALAACNGTISKIGVPAASPWNEFGTAFMSPHDDLTVVTTGSNISATLAPGDPAELCNSDQGKFVRNCLIDNCGLADCQSNAPAGATNVIFVSQEFMYVLDMTLTRPAFTAGGVEVVSASAGTQGAIALTIDSAAGLSVGAGFTSGLVPVPATSSDATTLALDDAGTLVMGPHWDAFGAGQLCTDGTTTSCDPNVGPDGVLAACVGDPTGAPPDGLFFRVDSPPGAYSLTCGTVPVSLTVNPPFASVGDCISSLIAERCSGLKGQARAACNHSQQSVCQATFHG